LQSADDGALETRHAVNVTNNVQTNVLNQIETMPRIFDPAVVAGLKAADPRFADQLLEFSNRAMAEGDRAMAHHREMQTAASAREDAAQRNRARATARAQWFGCAVALAGVGGAVWLGQLLGGVEGAAATIGALGALTVAVLRAVNAERDRQSEQARVRLAEIELEKSAIQAQVEIARLESGKRRSR